MRYFLIGYQYARQHGTGYKTGFGNIFVPSETFPANELLRNVATEKCEVDQSDIIVTSLFEFKSEEDYDDFVRKSAVPARKEGEGNDEAN